MTRRFLLRYAALAAALLLAPALDAAELHAVSSGGFAAAYKVLAPEFERQTGNTLVADWGPSMGSTPNAVPQRIARGEHIDVLIMVGYALDNLVQDGKVAPGDAVGLARSGIGAAVKQGAAVPDVSTVDGLRQALLNARSIAYSDSASGVYIQNEMFKKMGIEDQVRPKAHMIPADPVGEVVAKGEAEIGFQQISELEPVHGITIAGPLPAPLQEYTIFSAGVLASSEHKQEARALIRFLSSPEAAKAITDSGMEPMNGAR
jgi:molybdate transport system substrate-binding protein